jgi:hypothetical protein
MSGGGPEAALRELGARLGARGSPALEEYRALVRSAPAAAARGMGAAGGWGARLRGPDGREVVTRATAPGYADPEADLEAARARARGALLAAGVREHRLIVRARAGAAEYEGAAEYGAAAEYEGAAEYEAALREYEAALREADDALRALWALEAAAVVAERVEPGDAWGALRAQIDAHLAARRVQPPERRYGPLGAPERERALLAHAEMLAAGRVGSAAWAPPVREEPRLAREDGAAAARRHAVSARASRVSEKVQQRRPRA